MPKIVCPYCFEEFKRSDVMFRCTNDGCIRIIDGNMSRFWGQDRQMAPAFNNNLGKIGRMRDKMPNSAECPQCGHESFSVICPCCHNVIPKEMVKNRGYIISVIGARSSGKTNYITVLIDQLKKYGGKLGNLGILASTVADDRRDCTQVRYQTDFYDVLFKRGVLPAQNRINDQRSKVPLIYTVTQKGVKDPLYLVFYDTAGENFNDPRNIEKNARFLNQSDAIIFLLDTFSIPYVHEKLNINQDIELNYDVVLNNIIDYFKRDKKSADVHFKKPMALAFSKIDAILQHAEKFEDTSIPGMSIDQNSPYLSGGGVSLNDINSVSKALHDVLSQSWSESNFVLNIGNHYKNHRYFGFSALGKEPNADNTISGIQPYRVLDPLVWILNELKYPLLKSKEKTSKYSED